MGNNISNAVMNDYYAQPQIANGVPIGGSIGQLYPVNTPEEIEKMNKQFELRQKQQQKMQEVSAILALAEDLLIARTAKAEGYETFDVNPFIEAAEIFYKASLEYKNKQLEALKE